jgi:osmotically inducible protein OsmC
MAGITRTAQAEWQGTGKEGKGTLTTRSGVLSATPYGFNTRFGDQKGTNPEELIAAAHAGCFAMAPAGCGLHPYAPWGFRGGHARA